MTRHVPDFDDLVDELDSAEREPLLQAHELLAAAGPPPEPSARLARPPATGVRSLTARRSLRGRPLAVAAALAVAAFAVGVVTGDRLREPGTFTMIELAGAGSAPEASASIEVFDRDSAGNWPMELSVRELDPAPGGRLYELWLTHDGELTELCGSFLAETDGSTVVPMNAPWRLDAFDGWVVVEAGSRSPVLST